MKNFTPLLLAVLFLDGCSVNISVEGVDFYPASKSPVADDETVKEVVTD